MDRNLNLANEKELTALIRAHLAATGSPRAAQILKDWKSERSRFVKVCPVEYRKQIAARTALTGAR